MRPSFLPTLFLVSTLWPTSALCQQPDPKKPESPRPEPREETGRPSGEKPTERPPRPREEDPGGAAAKAEAKKYFEEGQRHYERGRYAKAVEAFLKAYGFSKHPVIIYNLALAYAMRKKWVKAATYLRIYLKKVPDAARRLPRALRRARRKVATLIVEVPDPKAEIYVDGKRRGKRKVDASVMPGQRGVERRLGDRIVARKMFQLARGQEKHWELTRASWEKVQKEPLKPPIPVKPPVVKRRWRLGRLHWAYFAAAAGLTAAALAVSVWTSIKTKQLHDRYMDDRSNVPLYNEGNRYRDASTAMWIATGVVAAGAVALAVFTRWRAPEPEKAAQVSVSPLGPFGISLSVTWDR
jgi:tetratricopeptide (TPR) repeat protein